MNYRDYIRQLAAELDGNDRLRFGFYFIAILGLIWVVLVLSDANREGRREYMSLNDQVAELKSVGTLEQWQERLQRQVSIEERLRSRLWTAATENQILASVQSTIRKLAENGGVVNVNVTLGTPQLVDEEVGLMRVRTRVRGNFSGDDALSFISTVEDFSPLLQLDELSLRIVRSRAASRNRLNADVVAYYLQDGGTFP